MHRVAMYLNATFVVLDIYQSWSTMEPEDTLCCSSSYILIGTAPLYSCTPAFEVA